MNVNAAGRWIVWTGVGLAGAVEDGADECLEDLRVQGGLVPEVVVDHRLVDAGGPGDAVHAGAVEAAGGELGRGGGEEAVAGIGPGRSSLHD